jgi:predicted transcriptional regulator
LEELEILGRVSSKIAPGRFPSFVEAHVLKALEEICVEKAVGRLKLSKVLHLGEGETRTLVKHLKNEGLIDVSKSGISLSVEGRRLLSSLRALVSEQIEIPQTPLTVGPFNIAVLVKGMKHAVKYGVEERDSAMVAGAKGATTLIFIKNKLIIPGTNEDLTRRDPQILALFSKLSLHEGDVVIIGSGDDKIRAELGAKSAALQLLRSKDPIQQTNL